MARYWVVLGVLAVAVGALWRAARLYNIPLLEMAGTIGVFLLGLGLSLTLTRQQTLSGRKAVEETLTALGPQFIITDWAEGYGPPGAPDYVVMGPAAVVLLTLDPLPNSARGARLARKLDLARERTRRAQAWVAERLAGVAPAGAAPLQPVLVLTRKLVEGAEFSTPDLPVLNPHHLRELFNQLLAPERLTAAQRVDLTRRLRQAAAAAGKGRR